ncbi:NAD(P)/FAD-dependent oxidoreductase [Spelaeicoccus albus]|uniref:Glycine/D-amino acid oxidase-like deaminating enzyme n=1 Tax=Spelaeicoccus albus TaxID=1280376 RepID=A0A7Z0D1X0_9MICO|nr:FAD-dependent oxidoreductase [Spelaeicoccus albus]NYI67060.1 glycine/D-amino acid oxidase-like deaminating enzyme [Spelaeicoccus albus]
MKIVVIGAGSVGAHVAFRLSKEGADVVLVDSVVPGQGTTASSIAWLSQFPQTSWEEEPGKAKLRLEVDELFRQVESEVPGKYVEWPGTLLWGHAHERADLKQAASVSKGKGVDVRLLDAQAARDVDANVALADDELVFWEPGSGWVDGPEVVRVLVSAAVDLGAVLKTQTTVVGIRTAGGAVQGVDTSKGEYIECDGVVNAAGSWGSHIAALADLAIPLDLIPGRIVYTAAVENLPKVIVNGPEWCARPDPSGGLAVHWRGGPQEPGHGSNVRTADEVIREISYVIPALEGTSAARTSIGIRPIPPGGPIVGALPWLENFYFTLSHGGIGWGPMWGKMAALELLHGGTNDNLAAMRPERFYLDPVPIGRYADDAEQ